MRVGTDCIEIDRVRRLVERHGEALCGRIFTPYEWRFCQQKPFSWPSFAVRFAAKEAVAKALRVGFCAELRWISIEVRSDEKGAPFVCFDEKGERCLQKQKGTEVQLSLSHDRTTAFAVAILL